MAVKLSDLPPHVRRQVADKAGVSRRSKPSRSVRSVWTRGTCGACDWEGTDRHDQCDRKGCDCFAAHARDTGHVRFVFDLGSGVAGETAT